MRSGQNRMGKRKEEEEEEKTYRFTWEEDEGRYNTLPQHRGELLPPLLAHIRIFGTPGRLNGETATIDVEVDHSGPRGLGP